jgi:hypothetical protein
MKPTLTWIKCKKCKELRPYFRKKCSCGATEVYKSTTKTRGFG